MPERIYLIYNPLDGSKDWVSEREFKIGSQKLRNVFGVLYLSDVKFMLQYNSQFKESIMNEYQMTNEKNISLHHVCRMISCSELTNFLNRSNQGELSYPTDIELKDGFFQWNEEDKCYDEVMTTK